MFELSACIEWLFAPEEPDFVSRVALAASAGLPAIEFWTWRDKDLKSLRTAIADNGTQISGFVSQPEARLVDPASHAEFLSGVGASSSIAQSLDCQNLIVLAGDRLEGVSDEDQRAAVITALRRAGGIAGEHGVNLLLEPLNTRIDHVGHFLDSTADGLSIIEEVNAPNVLLLLDLYHSAVMDERLDEVVDGRIALVGHVHLADTHGRHEPGTGDIDWSLTISWLRQAGYAGRLGLEYMPTCGSTESLGYFQHIVEALAAS